MAVKAKNKHGVTLPFWIYDDERFAGKLSQEAGDLCHDAGGQCLLIVRRGEQEERARRLIKRLTGEGIIGPTKAKPRAVFRRT